MKQFAAMCSVTEASEAELSKLGVDRWIPAAMNKGAMFKLVKNVSQTKKEQG